MLMRVLGTLIVVQLLKIVGMILGEMRGYVGTIYIFSFSNAIAGELTASSYGFYANEI